MFIRPLLTLNLVTAATFWNSCGQPKLGGIVDNGNHPEEESDKRENAEKKVKAATTLFSRRAKVVIPNGFVESETSNTRHVFVRSSSDKLVFTITSTACNVAVTSRSAFGTDLRKCSPTLAHFRLASGMLIQMDHNLTDSDLNIVASTIDDLRTQ